MKVTANDIDQLLASRVPREVPARVVKAAQGGHSSWLVFAVGLFFGGFGMIFVLIFFPWNVWKDWRLAAPDARTTSGVVTAVEEAHLTINDVAVMEYRFDYTPENGAKTSAGSFATGSRWPVGSSVTVQYLPSQPDLARIEGARLTKVGGMGFWVILFPVFGFGVCVWTVISRRRIRQLLRTGEKAEVDVLNVEATRVKINYQTVYKITLSAPRLAGGNPVTIKRWGKSDVNLVTQCALQKRPVFVLYDPRRMNNLIFPEALIESRGGGPPQNG